MQEQDIGGMTECLKFWSPLNDSFKVPDNKSKCAWSTINKEASSPHRTQEWRRTSKVLPNILSTIGNTPMIRLNKIPQSEGLKCEVYVKCEFFNPGGSVKDRIGYRMVEDAERQGLLIPGSTIIEPTSGNTGIGIALAAAVKGYRCIIVMSEKMSNEKVTVLQALGAKIVRTPVTADSNSPEGMFGMTHKLKKEIRNSVILDQYSNPGNPLAHYDTTAEEIYDQLDKDISMIIIGSGTGGTISGIGRKFREISPKTVIVAADPEGSILAVPESLNETKVDFYEVEGIGYDFIPTVLDRSVVDLWIKTNDQTSLPMARRLIREEGLLCGSSSGAAMVACIEAARHLQPKQKVVVILPDGIRNYMSKFVTDQWMEARLLQPITSPKNHWWSDVDISELKLKRLRGFVKTNTICMEAGKIMKRNSVNQVPVVDDNGAMFGMLTMQNLMKGINTDQVNLGNTVEKCIIRVYPKVYAPVTLGLISRILEKEDYVVILELRDDQVEVPVGVLSPLDLYEFVAVDH